jgi:phosphotransferase system HPr (HPr) family protein
MDAPIEEKIVVSNTLGLHARVATMIVQKMQNYDCQVSLTLHGVEVNARSVLGLLLLAASPGSEVLVKAEGAGSHEAIEEIRQLVQDEHS